jgi:TetR/AcrR family transcriptional regulator, transcriptional repressor for nem operon
LSALRRSAEAKRETHARIVEVAALRLRELGLEGAGVLRIMKDAGLTHGGFYSHFSSKSELVVEALRAAFTSNRERWLRDLDRLDDATWLRRVIGRYLNRSHRDAVADGCPVPALATELAREGDDVRGAFEEELLASVQEIARRLDGRGALSAFDRALGLVALLGGGVVLARAVRDRALSDRILSACRALALELVKAEATQRDA